MFDKEKIKAVLFDFDDTLGNREVYAYACFREFLKANTSVTDPVEFEAILQDCMLWDEKGNANKHRVTDMLAEKYGIIVSYDVFNSWWAENLWKYCVAFEDAEETLEYLSRTYKLGIVTNGPSEGQRRKVEHAGLSRFFSEETVIVSGDYPFAKPDVRIFRIACERLGVLPEETIFVGDIYANDILGSYRAGLHPVWIWTHGDRICSDTVPVIRKVRQLSDIL